MSKEILKYAIKYIEKLDQNLSNTLIKINNLFVNNIKPDNQIPFNRLLLDYILAPTINMLVQYIYDQFINQLYNRNIIQTNRLLLSFNDFKSYVATFIIIKQDSLDKYTDLKNLIISSIYDKNKKMNKSTLQRIFNYLFDIRQFNGNDLEYAIISIVDKDKLQWIKFETEYDIIGFENLSKIDSKAFSNEYLKYKANISIEYSYNCNDSSLTLENIKNVKSFFNIVNTMINKSFKRRQYYFDIFKLNHNIPLLNLLFKYIDPRVVVYLHNVKTPTDNDIPFDEIAKSFISDYLLDINFFIEVHDNTIREMINSMNSKNLQYNNICDVIRNSYIIMYFNHDFGNNLDFKFHDISYENAVYKKTQDTNITFNYSDIIKLLAPVIERMNNNSSTISMLAKLYKTLKNINNNINDTFDLIYHNKFNNVKDYQYLTGFSDTDLDKLVINLDKLFESYIDFTILLKNSINRFLDLSFEQNVELSIEKIY